MNNFDYLAMLFNLLIITGIYLLISSYRGRRVGTEPHCKKCDYILLHLQSPRCPECGTTISPQNTLIGERQRYWRWKRTITGIILIFLCLPDISPLREAIEHFPWYRYKPASFVLADLDDPRSSHKAVEELERRELAKTLPEPIRQKLVERALDKQVVQTALPIGQAYLLVRNANTLQEYLSEAFMDGRLTQPEMDRFLDQAIFREITVLPIVPGEGEVVFHEQHDGGLARITTRYYGPPEFWYQYQRTSCKLNGQLAYPITDSKDEILTFRLRLDKHRLPAGPVGKYTLEMEGIGTIWYGTRDDETASRKISTRTYTTKANYEIVP